MHDWHASYDPETHGHRHSVPPGFGHALFAPIAAGVFKVLRVSAAVWAHGQEWLPIHGESQQVQFEFEHGREADRALYNLNCLEQAQSRKSIVRGEYAGFSDLFVPIQKGENIVGVLVVGSFLRQPLSTAGIIERWHSLTGRTAHASDQEFLAYAAALLPSLVLDKDQAAALERLLECLASLMAGAGAADELMNEIEVLRAELEGARFVERVWELMRDTFDDLYKRNPQTGARGDKLRDVGLVKVADHVLVGLLADAAPIPDLVDEMVRRYAFQREVVALAASTGHAVAGRVGDQGVVFLSGAGGSSANQKRKLEKLLESAGRCAKNRGFSLHFGVSVTPASAPVVQSYQAALLAAESALKRQEKVITANPDARPDSASLPALRRKLGSGLEEGPKHIVVRFERYLEAVSAECMQRLEPARVHLEVGFERLTEAMLRDGVLDEKGLSTMSDRLSRAARQSVNVAELLAVYRRAVLDLSQAVRAPAPAQRDRSLRSAIEHIQQHYAESLSRSQVARVAGFAPGYFSELFKQREGVSFEQYVLGLRIERAKQLLDGTDLEVKRVAERSGFKSSDYFIHAFRRVTGVTPLTFRKDHRRAPRAPGSPGRLSD